MSQPHATPEGTRRFASRQSGIDPSFYRLAQGLTVSSIGLGTYLGEMDEPTDDAYIKAIQEALSLGLNFLDTSLNYRHQRSEKNIGAALTGIDRNEVVLCTKAGFLVPNAVPMGRIAPSDVAGGMHCLAPAFLEHQLEQSLANLRVSAVDIFYLHNPETQIRFVSNALFQQRLRDAFEMLEAAADRGSIQFYGVATWEGFRKADQLSIVHLEQIARELAGDKHRFRFVQLPFNLSMSEALASDHESLNGKSLSPITAAAELGITVVASASLLQARLATGLPDALASQFPDAHTDAQRALQFTRSTPGLTTALVGMSKAAHVRENLELRTIAPLDRRDYDALWRNTA